MQALIERIRTEGQHIGKGIIKLDSFMNHQIDPALTMEMGRAFAAKFAEAGVSGVTRVITAEVSGIGPALATASVLGVPMVYARKHRPITMPDGFFRSTAPSPTKGHMVELMLSPQYLCASDRVLLIDDFLASGLTIEALARLIEQSEATLLVTSSGGTSWPVLERSTEMLSSVGTHVMGIVLNRFDPAAAYSSYRYGYGSGYGYGYFQYYDGYHEKPGHGKRAVIGNRE